MIAIKEFQGRFGNRILHYNNMVQIAKSYNMDWNSIPYKDFDFLNIKNNYILNDNYKEITSKDILNEISLDNKNYFLKPCLGDLFFHFNYNTREIFTVKEDILDKDNFNIAINFRGSDFHQWNPESILSLEYYINSIESVHKDNNKYYLFTDDINLNSYKDLIKWLNFKKYKYSFGIATFNEYHFIEDFYAMADCDLIISSPSTFAICAGFMGKDKEIIHSEKWVNSRVNKNDLFWLKIKEGGNNNYKVKTLI